LVPHLRGKKSDCLLQLIPIQKEEGGKKKGKSAGPGVGMGEKKKKKRESFGNRGLLLRVNHAERKEKEDSRFGLGRKRMGGKKRPPHPVPISLARKKRKRKRSQHQGREKEKKEKEKTLQTTSYLGGKERNGIHNVGSEKFEGGIRGRRKTHPRKKERKTGPD